MTAAEYASPDDLAAELARLREENAQLKARVAELEAPSPARLPRAARSK